MEGEGGEAEEEEAKPLPTWRPGDPVNAAAAACAFRKCRDDLLTGITDPLRLANKLYSEDVVSKEVCDQILFLNITPTEKSMRLLTAVETRLSGHPSDFMTLVNVLEADHTLKTAVNRLKECYVEFCGSSVQEILPQVSTDPLDVFVASLKAVYRNTPVLPSNEEYPTPTTTYTNLAIVKKEHTSRAVADKFTRDTLHGGLDEIMRVKEPISIEDVLKVKAGGSLGCVLVEGAPGVGKSTFALQLCRQWDRIKAMSRFAVVVLLRLREKRLQNATSVADLFYHDLPHIQQGVMERITSAGGDKVLLVLDGFDEFPAHLRSRSIIVQVVQGTFPSVAKATILVTSRPSARADLLKLRPKPDKHIEVLGFTSDLIEQYASSTLGSDPPLLADFRTYLIANPVIKSMMYVPLHSAIVVEIYRENRVVGRPIPQTMTQLYTELTLTRLRSCLIEVGYLQADLPTDLEDLPQGIRDQLLSLAKLAFEGTQEEEVIFDKLPDGCSSLGLMVVSQELYVGRRGSLSYNFFHLTLQEFLSAFYISKLPATEQKELFRRNELKKSHMKVVRKFVAGLTGFEEIGWNLTSDDRGRVILEESVVQELFEAQDKVDYQSVVGDSVVDFSPGGSFSSVTVFDFFAIGHCVAASRNPWRITFPPSDTSSSWQEQVEMLVCGLKSRVEIKGSIQYLRLVGVFCREKDLLSMTGLPLNVLQQVSSLQFYHCSLDRVVFDLLADIVVAMTSLKKLWLIGMPVEDGALVKLLNASSCLRELGMSLLSLGGDDVAALSHLLIPSGNLKVLTIGSHQCSPEVVKLMLKTVLSPSSLEDLSIVDTDMTFALFREMEGNCNLTNLVFRGCTVRNKSFCTIVHRLHNNSTLKSLKMTDIEYPGFDVVDINGIVVALADMLIVNRTLNRLTLGLFNMDGKMYKLVKKETEQYLVSAIQSNHTVEELTIHLGPFKFSFPKIQ